MISVVISLGYRYPYYFYCFSVGNWQWEKLKRFMVEYGYFSSWAIHPIATDYAVAFEFYEELVFPMSFGNNSN